MNYSISRLTNNSQTRRLARYMAVGLLSTGVDFSILVVLKSLGLSTLVANSLSYGAGLVTSFVLNYLWTFSDSRSKRVPLQFAQCLIIGVCGLLLNNALVLVLISHLGQFFTTPDNAYIPAKVVASCIVLLWNFSANRLWTFNDIGWKRP
jgi:putative flippase GtrA